MKSRLLAIALLTSATFVSFNLTTMVSTPAYAASEIALIVNNNAITNTDIKHRAAFLKLQQRKGNLNSLARQELTDEMIKRVEIAKRGIVVSDSEINQAYGGFASSNNMTKDQLDQVMNQAGVTPAHFKTYIGTQIGWSRLVGARYQSENGGGMISEHDAVQRMLKNGGKKPSTNEYTLEQVIFVIPAKGGVGNRQAQANAFRAASRGCDGLRNQAKGQMDVTVRSLGRVLELQLPPEWSKSVIATPVGRLTQPRRTERGIEMLAVCAINKVSDDRVARLTFSIQDSKKSSANKADAISEKYMKELRAAARIQNP